MSRFTILMSTTLLLTVSIITGCGTTPVSAAQTGPAGPPGLVFTGPYVSTTHYVVTDVVTYQGSSYVALKAATAVAPIGDPNSINIWAVLAQAGAAGATGAIGPNGIPGPQGAQGAAGPTGKQGNTGATGPQGIAGPVGPVGATGANGAAGARGSQGATGAQGIPGLQGATGPEGPEGPAGPKGATGATGPQGAAGVDAVLQGRRFGVQGDSISSLFQNAWQNIVVSRTAMKQTYQEARPGRSFITAFECYGNPAVGGTLGVFDSSIAFPSVSGNCGEEAGVTNGNTLAQNVADVDLLVIELGTNDQSEPLGELGDPTTEGTFYGNLRWVVETYLTAKPTLRVIIVSVQYNTKTTASKSLACANAAVSYGATIGVPVINMYALGGVNALTLTTLTVDGVHPNQFDFDNDYGPVIAQGIQHIF